MSLRTQYLASELLSVLYTARWRVSALTYSPCVPAASISRQITVINPSFGHVVTAIRPCHWLASGESGAVIGWR